jgi:hypothetical protein
MKLIDGGKGNVIPMTIEISYDFLNNSNIMNAVGKLSQAPGYKQSILVRMAQVVEQFGKALHQAQTEYQEILEGCCEKDEKGQYKVSADKRGPLVKPELQDVFDRSMEEWKSKKIVITKPPFDLYELAPANLTPNDLNALKPFIKELKG